MKAIERLFEYIEFKGIKPKPFEEQIGLSNGYLGKQLKRKADLGEGIFIKIIENCPEINPQWLLIGNGSMLINGTSFTEIKADDRQKDQEIERLKDKINDLQTINELLTRTVADLDKRNSTVQYLERKHDLFDHAAEPAPELMKKEFKKNDDAKK
jgi:hypothetical protein